MNIKARKDIGTVIHYLLGRNANGRWPCVEYIAQRPAIFEYLLAGHDDYNIAFQCGSILRDCMKHEALCRCALTVPRFESSQNPHNYLTQLIHTGS